MCQIWKKINLFLNYKHLKYAKVLFKTQIIRSCNNVVYFRQYYLFADKISWFQLNKWPRRNKRYVFWGVIDQGLLIPSFMLIACFYEILWRGADLPPGLRSFKTPIPNSIKKHQKIYFHSNNRTLYRKKLNSCNSFSEITYIVSK